MSEMEDEKTELQSHWMTERTILTNQNSELNQKLIGLTQTTEDLKQQVCLTHQTEYTQINISDVVCI